MTAIASDTTALATLANYLEGAGLDSKARGCTVWFSLAERDTIVAALRAYRALPMASRQAEILKWAIGTFGAVAASKPERVMRFVEEAIELAHALGLSLDTLGRIAERVYGRPPGNPNKEIGQAAMTLEALAEVISANVDQECAAEFDRVQAIPASHWAERHAAKVKIGITADAAGMDQPTLPMAWQPIETAPKDGREILISSQGNGRKVARWDEGGFFTGWYIGMESREHCGGMYAVQVTHWQPLDDAPVLTSGDPCR